MAASTIQQQRSQGETRRERLIAGRVTLESSDQGVPNLIVEALDTRSTASGNGLAPFLRMRSVLLELPSLPL